MYITLLFEKVFGLYFIITAILALSRQQNMLSVARVFGKDHAYRFSMAALMTLGGLFMVVSYYDWSTLAKSIITLTGWLVLVKGLVLFYMSDAKFMKLVNGFNKEWWYTAWGVVMLLVGAYLAALGFGFWA